MSGGTELGSRRLLVLYGFGGEEKCSRYSTRIKKRTLALRVCKTGGCGVVGDAEHM